MSLKSKFINLVFYLTVSIVVVRLLGWSIAKWMYEDTPTTSFVYICIFSPFWEEAFYRWAPIEAARKLNIFEEVKWPLIFTTSIFFALAHEGPLSILIQGSLGFLLSLLYIKNKFSYISAVSLHMLWNILIFTKIM